MQTLLRFWHWHRNEKPSVELTRKKRDQLLSPLAKAALHLAVEQIAARASCGPDEWGPHWPALELAESERRHAPTPVFPPFTTSYERARFAQKAFDASSNYYGPKTRSAQ